MPTRTSFFKLVLSLEIFMGKQGGEQGGGKKGTMCVADYSRKSLNRREGKLLELFGLTGAHLFFTHLFHARRVEPNPFIERKPLCRQAGQKIGTLCYSAIYLYKAVTVILLET